MSQVVKVEDWILCLYVGVFRKSNECCLTDLGHVALVDDDFILPFTLAYVDLETRKIP